MSPSVRWIVATLAALGSGVACLGVGGGLAGASGLAVSTAPGPAVVVGAAERPAGPPRPLDHDDGFDDGPDEFDEFDDLTLDDPAIDALISLDAEVALLVELGAFPDALPESLVLVHELWLPFRDDADDLELLGWLEVVDLEGSAVLEDLIDAGVEPSAEVRTVLAPLTSEQFRAAREGRQVGIEPVIYEVARQHLLAFDGEAPPDRTVVPAPPATSDLTDVGPAAGDAARDEVADGTVGSDVGSGRAAPRGGDDSVSALVPLGIGAVALSAIAVVGWWLARRRSAGRTVTAASPTPLPPPPPRPTADPGRGSGTEADHFDRLLESGRRMTAATDATAVAAIAVADAMAIVGARCGAFVSVDEGGLDVVHEEGPFLDRRSLGDGVIARVADTGQVVRRVEHDEPAITALPASMLVVPVVGGGRVTGVVFLVRPDSEPFDDRDEDAVSRLAPMIGSALATATKLSASERSNQLDDLTRLRNRRGLDVDLPAELSTTHEGRTSGVVMIDVDHFKTFNDANGHVAGDAALRTVAEALRTSVREQDTAYRYGGEEFALLLRDVDRTEAELVAERVRAAVESSVVDGESSQPGGTLTISVGVALVVGLDADDALRLADGALYEAKESGRNRVVLVDGAAAVSSG